MHRRPTSVPFGIGTDASSGRVDELQRFLHQRRGLTERVGGLVDAKHRRESEVGLCSPDVIDDEVRDIAVDIEPAGDVSSEMDASNSPSRLDLQPAEAIPFVKAARHRRERAEGALAQLEDRWRTRIDVGIDAIHLHPDVTPGVVGKTARGSVAVEPSDSWQTNRARKTAHQKRSVCRAGH